MLTPYIQFKFYYFKHKLFFAVESIERYRLVWRVRRKSFLLFCFLCTRTEKKLTFNLEKPFLCKQILFLSCRHFVCVQGQKKSCFFYNWNLFLWEVLSYFDAWRLLFDNLLDNDKAIDFSVISHCSICVQVLFNSTYILCSTSIVPWQNLA